MIDSGAAISLLCYSTYQHIVDSFKTPIQPTTAKLNTVNSLPMTALGMTLLCLWIAGYQHIVDSFKTPIQPTTAKLNTANSLPMTALGMTLLCLWIAGFKFTHNFVICNRLPDTKIIFGIDIQKTFSLSYAWNKEKNCYIQRDGKILAYTKNCEQKVTIGTVKPLLKIPPGHNGVIPIKIRGLVIEGHMAYFITNNNSKKRKRHQQKLNSIHNIKGKTSVNVLVSNYTNKHIMFNKGEYMGCLEPAITEDMFIAQQDTLSTNSVTLQKMMSEQVQLDIFNPPHHKLKAGIKSKLDTLYKEYPSQFAKMKHPLEQLHSWKWPLTQVTQTLYCRNHILLQ